MIWAVIVLSLALVAGVFIYGKKRGKIEYIHDNLDAEKEKDKKEAQDELDKKNEDDGWDNLDNTLDDLRKRDRR